MKDAINKNLFKHKKIETDPEGYLKKTKDWNIILAREIAEKENIFLKKDHWKVINFVRNFYLKFNTTPSMRMLIRSIKLEIGEKKSNSIYLHKLFPQGPAKQASKIAGIPKPVKCL
ncbi:TusE/DsrC/DsvC family sulfur relay protein [Buchnera aphidicola (Muscaphis stroyani)]|uniref:Sulfurtransferase n=1 Tax=Buchnera aphidicola (Muscaphis stroyani) TaxID=1241869 RepID=A0A4D6YJ39_9GAMM|nr:TusE/DsrC/DsvC family sulfur relay protein [Buchnera aphidicola]QCI24505.1 TusE/DsrC/DsvC family sulfur relay protein [Buchnera aphidicola (Muscaphis stroyani)]